MTISTGYDDQGLWASEIGTKYILHILRSNSGWDNISPVFTGDGGPIIFLKTATMGTYRVQATNTWGCKKIIGLIQIATQTDPNAYPIVQVDMNSLPAQVIGRMLFAFPQSMDLENCPSTWYRLSPVLYKGIIDINGSIAFIIVDATNPHNPTVVEVQTYTYWVYLPDNIKAYVATNYPNNTITYSTIDCPGYWMQKPPINWVDITLNDGTKFRLDNNANLVVTT
jgi:hypothetical protein